MTVSSAGVIGGVGGTSRSRAIDGVGDRGSGFGIVSGVGPSTGSGVSIEVRGAGFMILVNGVLGVACPWAIDRSTGALLFNKSWLITYLGIIIVI